MVREFKELTKAWSSWKSRETRHPSPDLGPLDLIHLPQIRNDVSTKLRWMCSALGCLPILANVYVVKTKHE